MPSSEAEPAKNNTQSSSAAAETNLPQHLLRSEGHSTSFSQEQRQQQVFIKSFVFQPDLPIRIDYEAKGFKTEMVGGVRLKERAGMMSSDWVMMSACVLS